LKHENEEKILIEKTCKSKKKKKATKRIRVKFDRKKPRKMKFEKKIKKISNIINSN
jgi:hypothetical protein